MNIPPLVWFFLGLVLVVIGCYLSFHYGAPVSLLGVPTIGAGGLLIGFNAGRIPREQVR